jgi:hypothetical protein
VNEFEKELTILAAHLYRAHHQFQQIRELKNTLTDTDCLLHVDFSENYSTKWASEVQSAHFGDRPQIVLHQGIAYRKVRHLLSNRNGAILYHTCYCRMWNLSCL